MNIIKYLFSPRYRRLERVKYERNLRTCVRLYRQFKRSMEAETDPKEYAIAAIQLRRMQFDLYRVFGSAAVRLLTLAALLLIASPLLAGTPRTGERDSVTLSFAKI